VAAARADASTDSCASASADADACAAPGGCVDPTTHARTDAARADVAAGRAARQAGSRGTRLAACARRGTVHPGGGAGQQLDGTVARQRIDANPAARRTGARLTRVARDGPAARRTAAQPSLDLRCQRQ
jgi:hypothetical protein